jgi:predicted GH43/DUF377 family glycosyl hydrolase
MKLTRFVGNPILTPTDQSWENNAVFNPAVFRRGGNINLIYRAQGDDNVSRLGMVRMSNPMEISERNSKPVFEPDSDSEYEVSGVEDPRVSLIDDDFYMVYIAASKYPSLLGDPPHPRESDWRVRVSLAKTTDFENWFRYGVIISHIDSKDAAMFPEKINDQFYLLHRVIPQVRIVVSEDGRRYKERGAVFGPRQGMWDEQKVGVGAPPIRCPYGWLLFYHGVDAKEVYRLGLVLLDNHDPSLVIGRTNEPILEPVEEYEKVGRVPNVVFTCGAIEADDKYWVYYGAADKVIGVASISKEEVLNWAKEESAKSRFHEFEQIGRKVTEETEERRRHQRQ